MVVKTGVSLPNETYEQLSRLARSMGYSSVSRAIRDAVELFLAVNRWWSSPGRLVGAIAVVAPLEDEQGLLRCLADAGAEEYTVRRIPGAGITLAVITVAGEKSEPVKSLYRRLASCRGSQSLQAALLPLPRG